MEKSLGTNVRRERFCNYHHEVLYRLRKRSNLKIDEIADLICESYETTRKNLYNPHLSRRLWIKYYNFFTNYIRELDLPKDSTSLEQ